MIPVDELETRTERTSHVSTIWFDGSIARLPHYTQYPAIAARARIAELVGEPL